MPEPSAGCDEQIGLIVRALGVAVQRADERDPLAVGRRARAADRCR